MKKNSYVWIFLALLGAGLLVAAGCAMSHIQPDGTLAVTGTDVLPGGTGLTQDIAGAVADAIKDVNPTDIVAKAASRDWLGLGSVLVGIIAAIGGGTFVRQRIRKAAKPAAPPAEPVE